VRKTRFLHHCPNCHWEFQAAQTHSGGVISCHECKTVFNIPYLLDEGIGPPTGYREVPNPTGGASVRAVFASFPCKGCGRQLGWDRDLVNCQVTCPYCRYQFAMPTGKNLKGTTSQESMHTLQGILKVIRETSTLYYVYGLFGIDGKPFYIGKGSGDRIACHEIEVRDDAQATAKHQVIRDAKMKGLRVGYRLLGVFEEEQEALDAEKHWIAQYGRSDRGAGVLTNTTDGGEGFSEEYRYNKKAIKRQSGRCSHRKEFPKDSDLAPPRQRGSGDVKELGKCDHWTGMELPLVAFWQGSGLTVQVFNEDDNVGWNNNKFPTPVVIRVFDGAEKVLEDRSAFFLDHFGCLLSSPRPNQPPEIRLSAERRLIANVLYRLADVARELDGARFLCHKDNLMTALSVPNRSVNRHERPKGELMVKGGLVRFDTQYGRRNFSKRLQAWVKDKCRSLRDIASALEE